MEKSYERINWENEPSILTPLNAVNLNKMDYSINEIDDRVVLLNSTKAAQSDLLLSVKGITYNQQTGVFVFTWQNGTTLEVDLNIEKIPVSFSMSASGVITMETSDGTEYTCDVAELIKAYLFDDSDQIAFTVTTSEDGSYHVTGTIKSGSITEEMLESGILGRINSAKGYAEEALNKATEAATSAVMAQSYAKGGTGTREGEDVDNAKYYAERAKETDIGIISDEVNEIKSYIVQQKDSGYLSKNLLNATLQTTTLNGMTCTNNGDGTYTLNGTTSNVTVFDIASNIPSGSYRLVGCPKNGEHDKTYEIQIRNDSVLGYDIGNGVNVNAKEPFFVRIRLSSNITLNNLVFKPMLVDANLYPDITYDDFTPYAPSNIELQTAKTDNSVLSDVWNSTTTYSVGQYCIYNNSLWKCLVQNNGQTPTEGTYWTAKQIASEIASVKSSLGGLSFGTDGDGNYGYYGADGSLIPFNKGNLNLEVLKIFSYQSGSSSTAAMFTFTFPKNYKNVLVIITMHDTDNNGDNYCKVFSENQGAPVWDNFKNNPTDWKSIDMSSFIVSGTSLASVKNNYTEDEDKNKTIYYGSGTTSSTCFQVLTYKENVMEGEVAYMYVNTYRRCLVTLIGID